MLDHRRARLVSSFTKRIDEAYAAADAALADPNGSDIERREKIWAFLDAGSVLKDFAQSDEIH